MTDQQQDSSGGLTRRKALAALGAGGAAWLLRGTVGPDSAQAVGTAPAGLPAGVTPYQRVYENWAGEVRTDPLWVCAPGSPQQVADLADWARAAGWRLRPQGHRHGWAPLTVAAGTPASAQVLLLDTTQHLTSIALTGSSVAGAPTVRVQTGASMEDLLALLAGHGLGVTACPAPGDLTVGGVLAIGGHGTAVPATGETAPAGHGYGSLSSHVVSLTAVVWDAARSRYVLREFDRAESDSAAFLVQLGRAFLTEVVLRVGADRNLRCVSRLDIPATELFAAPGTSGNRTFADFVARDGRAEAIWYAFTSHPWLKTWRVTPSRPFAARTVTEPYNYPFSDNIPKPVAELAGQLIEGAWGLAPTFGQLQFLITKIGLTGDLTDVLLSSGLLRSLLTGELLTHLLADGLRSDLWGPSRALLQYVRPTTLRVTASGYAILARRADLQWAVSEFTSHYQRLLTEYQQRGEYPVNGAVEIRVTGLDDPAVSGVPGAQPPLLSALRPQPDKPEWDTAVWVDILTLPGTPGLHRFSRDLEQALLHTFDGTRAGLRVEWSKGWAYTDTAAWADQDVLTRAIPDSLRTANGPGWDEAIAVLDRHDPHRVFGNAFLDGLLRA
ncbi:FAD/FMN-containing dehydrogenase [Kitasatospora gansuensis]|uniref:FAD/FMN-containing dehydrogenase n=1 Tax=Kitasatospora gansuensis TaxID=258050 RepID=A0A7W7WLC4_9ACTN|nr:cholesterol oxidase substrate-binding domain-containing protein [Kitasatospora gansuensis]MBB4951316.1 FAD/FMN-containing dehydrogenase [Kitasatospora gansuensis]